jgi:hypothetical protein
MDAASIAAALRVRLPDAPPGDPTIARFADDLAKAQAARAGETHALVVQNFQTTFGGAPDVRSYFATVRTVIDGDPELRVALRTLPEGAALAQALAAGDVAALQRALNRRIASAPLAVDGQYGPATHDALLSWLGVARMAVEQSASAAVNAELALAFDQALGLGGLRRVPTPDRLHQHFAALLAELDEAPAFKTFLLGLAQGERVVTALQHDDALELNRIFGTGDPSDPAKSGYDFLTHSALALYLANAKERYVQVELQQRSEADAAAAVAAARKQQFQERLGVAPDQPAPPDQAAAYLKSLGDALKADPALVLKLDARIEDAAALGEALKSGDPRKLAAFVAAHGYSASSGGKLDLATFNAVEQLIDDMKACLAPSPPAQSLGDIGTDEGALNASLDGDTFFVSYSTKLDEKRALALKAGVGAHGLDSAEVWFNQQEENKRYTAALRADFLERAFAAKFDSEGHSEIGHGFQHEWAAQIGFAVLQGMYSSSLERRTNDVLVPGYTYDTAVLIAGARYGIGFDRTWVVCDAPDRKLTIGFNWHADIGARLAAELYHPPGNDRALASSQSGITFTDIAYLASLSEIHARTTANFTVDGEWKGVHIRGLAHLDSRIGLDDPTLGFTHNHNLAATLDLGFLNDRIAAHFGVNVPIYASTLDPTAANPIGTVGLALKPTDAFTLGASVTFNLESGQLLVAAGQITYTPERLFGWDTHHSVFISGSYSYDTTTGEQTAMVNLGVELGDTGAPRSVDADYDNPVVVKRPVDRTPRPADDTRHWESITCPPSLLAAIRPWLDQLQEAAKEAFAANNQALVEQKTTQAMQLLSTPQLVSAACNQHGGGIAEYQYHLDEPSKFTPAAFFAKAYGVCAEFHIFAAAALRLHHFQAYPIEFFAPGRSHVICSYRDDGGKWQILEYGEIHLTGGRTPEEALLAFEPGTMKYKIFEPEGGRAPVVEQGASPLIASLQDFFDRSWI